ncbi:TIGR04141 family sporadically distributed protein [Rhodospirillaceae bacterium AH-315-P19]|nr:TIGR04141 family sporadically distributed protein [Rhodospirillaceae bacterium AH-315-P19]
MSKSRSFSIYLLKNGCDATNALKDDHSLDETVAADALPEGASLFILNNPPREPWWKGYFSIQKSLRQATKGALIFLPVGKRVFALSFGHVFHNLKDASYEYDFGLRVTLNCVDPDKIKNTDVLEPGAARRQRTQVSPDSNLTYFDFDCDSTILKSLTGKVKAEHQELIKHATGASNLRISSAVAFNGLAGLCEKLLELYESDTYKTTFPDIQNIAPVRDPVVIKQLNGKLLEAFRAKSEGLALAIPDIVDYQDNVCATFSGAGKSCVYDDVFIDRYYEYLASYGRALADVELDDLRRHVLRLTDENGSTRDNHSIFKSFIYDTTLDGGGETYHLTEGNWYKVNNDYIVKLEAFLDPLCADLLLPAYTHNGEGAYNAAVAANDASYLCLDKTDISPTGQTQIEPCDLYSVTDDHAVFHHVKRSTLSKQLSHLFNQGANAVELLKLEEEAVEKLKQLINNKTAGSIAAFSAPIDAKSFEVVFAIITHKDKANKSKNLPLFSRVSLMRNMKALQLMSVKASYGFIVDQTSKAVGKKKPRKKKADGGDGGDEA